MATRKSPTTKAATVPRQPRTATPAKDSVAAHEHDQPPDAPLAGVGALNEHVAPGMSAKEIAAARAAIPTVEVAPPARPVSKGLDNSALEALAMRPAVIREGVHDARIDDPDGRYGALSLTPNDLTRRGNIESPVKDATYEELDCMGGGPLDKGTALVRTDARYYHAPSGDTRWPIALYERISRGDGSSILIYRGMT